MAPNKYHKLTVFQDLLRKSLYFNYPRYKALGHHAFKNEDDILKLHVCKSHSPDPSFEASC
jgi:hypothetical protein